MSLIGRYCIDNIKRTISSRWTLPVPPYGSAAYWERVYDKLNVTDVYEWADLDFEEDLRSIRYSLRKDHLRFINENYGQSMIARRKYAMNEDVVSNEEEFHKAIGVHGKSAEEETILFLGCGNSTFGEKVLQYYIDKKVNQETISLPKIVQCDVSEKLVSLMTERYQTLISSKKMSIVQDDATCLTLFDNNIDAVIDKGLMDALFCANEYNQMNSIMNSVNRSLKAGKSFSFFSFSRPEFLLQDMLTHANNQNIDAKMWSHVEVREMERIFMYQFIKGRGYSALRNKDDSSPGKHQKRSRKKLRRPI